MITIIMVAQYYKESSDDFLKEELTKLQYYFDHPGVDLPSETVIIADDAIVLECFFLL